MAGGREQAKGVVTAVTVSTLVDRLKALTELWEVRVARFSGTKRVVVSVVSSSILPSLCLGPTSFVCPGLEGRRAHDRSGIYIFDV